MALAGLAVATVASAAAGAGPARELVSNLKLHRIGRFANPTFVTQAPGEPGTVYVTEQEGRIVAVRHGRRLGRPFLEISDRVAFGPEEARSNESGLLSMAFDPGYRRNRRFYVFYTANSGHNLVERYRRSGGRAVRARPGSGRG